MRIGLWNYYEELNHPDKMFNPLSYTIGYGLEQPFVQLRALAQSHGSTVEPYYEDPTRSWDAVIFFDFPSRSPGMIKGLHDRGVETYLVILESVIHNNQNFNHEVDNLFRKVFTWNTTKPIAANTIYSPIPQDLTLRHSTIPWNQRKLACLVAGNKESDNPRALYNRRKRIIRWFERKAPRDFDLYGFGWDSGENLVPKWLQLIPQKLNINFHRPFPSYRGQVADKRGVLGHYRFSFCLENVQGTPGYVTEKIFDGMLAGTIPIYLGAPDIEQLIPKSCFIDLSHFRSIDELCMHMRRMTEDEHSQILDQQQRFLSSSQGLEFSAAKFAERVWRVVSQATQV